MPHSVPPTWVNDLAWAMIGLALASAAVIAYDIAVRGFRQQMWIMDLVYPLTALYWGPVAVHQYFRRGRVRARPVLARIGGPEHAADVEGGQRPKLGAVGWWPLSKAVSHCGAGCTLGDLAAEWIVFATGFTLAGIAIYDLAIWTPPLSHDVATYWLMMQLSMVGGFFTAMPVNALLIRCGWKEEM